MNNGLKSGLVLLVLGIICGTLLAVVNSLTALDIQKNEEAAQFAALEEFYNIDDYDLSVVEVNDDVDSIFVLRSKTDNSIEALGYLVSGKGYSDVLLQMMILIEKDFTVKGYSVVSHSESTGFGVDILENDFGVSIITDLSGFDSVAGVTRTSEGIQECFYIVSQRVTGDFGGDLDD